MSWQPIESAPRDKTRILIWNADEQQVDIAEWNSEFGVFDADGGAWWEVADCPYWHPLPSPPVEG